MVKIVYYFINFVCSLFFIIFFIDVVGGGGVVDGGDVVGFNL